MPRSSRKRKECRYCTFERFTVDATEATAKKHFGRARFFTKHAATLMKAIENTERLISLNPCALHKDQMLELRRFAAKVKKEQLKEKAIMRDNTQKLYYEALEKLAVLNLTANPNEDTVERLNNLVRHYREVLGQRERRIKELAKNGSPDANMERGLTSLE